MKGVKLVMDTDGAYAVDPQGRVIYAFSGNSGTLLEAGQHADAPV